MARRIVWNYSLPNGKKKVRHGKFYSKIKHRSEYMGQQMAMVQLDGNTRTTMVPYEELSEEDNYDGYK